MTQSTSSHILQLLQLADSALPIGAAAHSFGLETLVADGFLTPDCLLEFFGGWLLQLGTLDGAFCRTAHRLAAKKGEDFRGAWLELNRLVSARRPARESRTASATLGRRFLQLVQRLVDHQVLTEAWATSSESSVEIHHAPAFGLTAGALGWNEDDAALAYLQQSLMGAVSACQRLMPLGQSGASALLWDLQETIFEAAKASSAVDLDEISSFAPLLDLASMRHPILSTRLFIS